MVDVVVTGIVKPLLIVEVVTTETEELGAEVTSVVRVLVDVVVEVVVEVGVEVVAVVEGAFDVVGVVEGGSVDDGCDDVVPG